MKNENISASSIHLFFFFFFFSFFFCFSLYGRWCMVACLYTIHAGGGDGVSDGVSDGVIDGVSSNGIGRICRLLIYFF